MPTYVTLMRFTDQGIRTIKESPARLEAAKKLFQSAGAELKSFYLALGNYDAIAVIDGPNDEVAARLAIAIGAQGNLRTDTMRVFNEVEYRKLVSGLP
jgi:uncharacterized protein with GYD domain